MCAQKLSFDYAHTLHTVRIVHNAHSVHRSRVQKGKSCDCINFVRATDPCMGSGHILVYAFDVLMEIYRECGYSDRDAALSIIENNLYGIDIDNRAYQLAYFAVMMKARSYDRRALTRGVIPNIAAITETNGIERFDCEGVTSDLSNNVTGNYLIEVYNDAKETGSLVTVEHHNYDEFEEYLDKC